MSKLRIGHRGACGYKIENTLESVQKAIELNVDIIEIDIRPYKNKLILSHDEVDESKDYCTLYSVLEIIPKKIDIYLDVKLPTDLSLLQDIINNYSNIMIGSTDVDILEKIHYSNPFIRVGLIEDIDQVQIKSYYHFIALDHDQLTYDKINTIKTMYDIQIYLYTVNNIEDIERYRKMVEIDGIISDYPNI